MATTINQAELRNGSAGVMDALEAGEAFIITRNGRPVGELRPFVPQRDMSTTELKALLARFAGADSGAQERAEVDAFFGEERV